MLYITDIDVNNLMNKPEQLFSRMYAASLHCSCHVSLIPIYVFIKADIVVIKSSRKKSNLC